MTIRNVLLYRWGGNELWEMAPPYVGSPHVYGSWDPTATDPETLSMMQYGRREMYVEFADVKDYRAAQAKASVTLTPKYTPDEPVVVDQRVRAGEAPFDPAAYQLGDRVTAPNRAGSPTSMRVQSVTVKGNQDGTSTCAPVLQDKKETEQQRLERWIRGADTGMGSLAGVTEQAKTITGSVVNSSRSSSKKLGPWSANPTVSAGSRGTPTQVEVPCVIVRYSFRSTSPGSNPTTWFFEVNGFKKATITLPANTLLKEMTPITDGTGNSYVLTDGMIRLSKSDICNVEVSVDGGHSGLSLDITTIEGTPV